MARRNISYTCDIDFTNVKKTKRGYYDWANSIGVKLPFNYNNGVLVGEFVIVKYCRYSQGANSTVYLTYNGVELNGIQPYALTHGKICGILDKILVEWRFEIGERLKDENRDITIKARARFLDAENHKRRYYQIHCNKCGFDSGEHYLKGKYKKEWWVMEGDLDRVDKKGIHHPLKCPCCNNSIAVPTINSISTTDKWLVPYFKNKSEADKYVIGSTTEVTFKCPICNVIDHKKIILAKKHGINCICKDSISYPNKIGLALFSELEDQTLINNYISEYSPSWLGKYRYDNYFELMDKKYVVEMDGGLGHGNYDYNHKKDVEGKQRDTLKDKLATKHNITVIRIDCIQSEITYIKENIIKSELSDIIDFSNIDWSEISEKCLHNTYNSLIWNLYREGKNYKSIHEETHLSISHIKKVVSKGIKYNIVIRNDRDISPLVKHSLYKEQILKFCIQNGITSGSKISQELNLSTSVVISILHELTQEKRIQYEPEASKIYCPHYCPIEVYDLNMNLLKEYSSIKECVEESESVFGTKFIGTNISAVCKGKKHTHKGYIFRRKGECENV